MLGVNLRPAVARVWAPVVRTLLRLGVTADAITVLGTVGAVASAVFVIGNGVLFWGAAAVTVFVLLDMLDGALARARGGGSVFGAVLDSTGDRAADAAIFAALAWWFSGQGDNRMVVWLALTCLVLGVLTSYVKARAEGMGLTCDVGLVERTERLILVLVGTGFTGLGIPYALQVCLWLLLIGSTITVGQRFAAVYGQAKGRTLR
ncbi:CDP-diacylglycerol--glycerol-3-phosphate 3-phosphatidyltransferase [Klenkia marina]|uniref:Phosphatidylinositol phosphate synthase n=1 Tax=Klenkia marina TaxID=1960309 RepID=A0A1G4YB06_9ACTN|nr:CDP-alcohol phosphatidyltransferase family protein [Klenkia marina]SCX50651.1 CDP-diacylglycerol--glycerol-3-phosphate 3-phosphatidyltransferase [Klenkia marina]